MTKGSNQGNSNNSSQSDQKKQAMNSNHARLSNTDWFKRL